MLRSVFANERESLNVLLFSVTPRTCLRGYLHRRKLMLEPGNHRAKCTVFHLYCHLASIGKRRSPATGLVVVPYSLSVAACARPMNSSGEEAHAIELEGEKKLSRLSCLKFISSNVCAIGSKGTLINEVE